MHDDNVNKISTIKHKCLIYCSSPTPLDTYSLTSKIITIDYNIYFSKLLPSPTLR